VVRLDETLARQQLTFGLGPRLHFKLGGGHVLRPGISYTRAFDDPMKRSGYDVVQTRWASRTGPTPRPAPPC
jgi:hypothetical protein